MTVEQPSRVTKVLIVDDHPYVRQGLAALVSGQRDLVVCGEAADASEALSLVESTKPDVAIVDISLQGSNGIDLIAELKERYSSIRVLVSSIHDESLYAQRSLDAGASGYVEKQEASLEMITAIRCVLAGGVYLSQRMTEHLHRE